MDKKKEATGFVWAFRLTLPRLGKAFKAVLMFQLGKWILLKYPERQVLLLSFTPGKTEVVTLNCSLRAREICSLWKSQPNHLS